MFYDEKPYYDTLKFDDVFQSADQFATVMVSVGGITSVTSLRELYEILSLKYVASHTRYTDEFAFMMAIKRELYTEFPFYLQKKELANDMMEVEISEIQLTQNQLRNLIETNDEDYVNTSTKPIDDLTTTQENIRVTSNKLDAVKQKYNVMNRNYLQGIYKRCDELFRVILAGDTRTLYEQGDEE